MDNIYQLQYFLNWSKLIFNSPLLYVRNDDKHGIFFYFSFYLLACSQSAARSSVNRNVGGSIHSWANAFAVCASSTKVLE